MLRKCLKIYVLLSLTAERVLFLLKFFLGKKYGLRLELSGIKRYKASSDRIRSLSRKTINGFIKFNIMKIAANATTTAATFEIKGSTLTLLVLHLLESDVEATAQQLRKKFGDGSGFLNNAPLLIDLSEVQGAGASLQLEALVDVLRELKLVPIGIRGGSEEQNRLAINAGLGLLSSARSEREVRETVREPNSEPGSEQGSVPPSPPAAANVITQPIRSGQRVVVNGDLIVLNSVNSGAEILATGNIHVYGALRGRAFAGAQGDTEVRVFCLQFDPDLVAIAGEYLVNDELNKAHIGKTTLVSLRDDRLLIEPIGIFDPHE